MSGIRICLVAMVLTFLVQCTSLSLPAPRQQVIAPTQISAQAPAQGIAQPQVAEDPTEAPANSTAIAASIATPVATAESTASPTQETAPPIRSRFTPRPGDQVTQITPGIVHIRRVTPDPLKINVLLFDLTAPEFDIKTATGDGWLSGRHRTTHIAEQKNALAAVNGDLFSAAGIPEGLTIMDSKVAVAPKHRATFAWSKNREPFIGYFTQGWSWNAEAVAANGESVNIPLLNLPCDFGKVCLYNEYARYVPPLVGDVKVVLGPSGVVTDIVKSLRTRVITGTQVLRGTGAGARWLLNNVRVGDKIDIHIQTDPPLSDYAQAISGGPIILQNGQFTQDCLCALGDCSQTNEKGLYCEDFTTDWKLHHYLWVRMPRTGIGFDEKKQTLIVAVVDGYQLGYSRGITQKEFADLLHEFGAYTAMELDGGGSATMVLHNQIMNHPPDNTGERYVADALLFFWKRNRTTSSGGLLDSTATTTGTDQLDSTETTTITDQLDSTGGTTTTDQLDATAADLSDTPPTSTAADLSDTLPTSTPRSFLLPTRVRPRK